MYDFEKDLINHRDNLDKQKKQSQANAEAHQRQMRNHINKVVSPAFDAYNEGFTRVYPAYKAQMHIDCSAKTTQPFISAGKTDTPDWKFEIYYKQGGGGFAFARYNFYSKGKELVKNKSFTTPRSGSSADDLTQQIIHRTITELVNDLPDGNLQVI